jgi:hypothetical protein
MAPGKENDECKMMTAKYGTKRKETLDPCFRRGDVLTYTESQQRHSCESRNPDPQFASYTAYGNHVSAKLEGRV